MKITMNGDLFYYNLLFPQVVFLGYGTLDLALGTFGAFYLLGIRKFLIVILDDYY